MAMLLTADGRDLSNEEWRRIPEFPKYLITKDGDIRNIRSGKLLQEIERPDGVCYYSLWKTDRSGKSKAYNRNFQNLVYSAFPEEAPEIPPTPEKRPYIKRGLWKVVPGFPNFEVHPEHVVRYITSRRRVKPVDDIDGVPHVILRNEEGFTQPWRISRLVEEVFGKVDEDVEADPAISSV